VIRSRSNSLLKRVGAVVSGKERGLCLLEGDRLVDDAIEAGWELDVVLVSEDREERARALEALGCEVRRVEYEHLARVSELGTSPGILSLARAPAVRGLEGLDPATAQRVLVVAGIADPGNLGALARSAEAAGFLALVVVAGGARPFGPKALRGSMGSLLRLRVHEADDFSSLGEHLGCAGYRQIAATTRGGSDWRAFDWAGPLALWVSGETGDTLDEIRGLERVSIPMAGGIDSLNVTVAASLLLFAAGGAP
jgi:TrmH family RNA methyltransferase